MRLFIVLASFIQFISGVGQSYAAETSSYLCKQVESIQESHAVDITNTLNSMGCDTEKPFTVNMYPNSKYSLVCCVRASQRSELRASNPK
jgi:hypothetical protein